jgi:hypothetical protein
MERALAAIHTSVSSARGPANHGQQRLTLEYGTHEERVGLFLRFPDDFEALVTGPITANYPNCSIVSIDQRGEVNPVGEKWSAELELVPELLPILRHAQFEDLLNGNFADPITGILRAILPDESVYCRVEITITPASHRRCYLADRAVKQLDREFFRAHHRLARYFASHITRRCSWLLAWIIGIVASSTKRPARTTLETSSSRLHDREDDLQAASEKVGGHLFETHIHFIVSAPAEKERVATDRIRQMAGAFGAFVKSRLATFRMSRIHRGDVRQSRGRGFLLSHEELATLWHPPTATVVAEGMRMSEFTELEPPAHFYSDQDEGAVTLGRVRFRSDQRLIGIGRGDRRRHVYVVGSTGAGKSTLLLNQINADMQARRGLTVFDVHGDLAEAALRLVPKHRTNDVVLFDAASEHVIPFNPLACPDPERIDQVASGVVSAFRKLYDSWGPRLENLLRYAVFATVEQNGTLLSMLRLLTDDAFRDRVVPQIKDDIVRSFFQNEFASWNNQYRTEAVSSVTNKIMQFLTNRQLRAIVAADGRRSLNLRQVMDREQILIINISRGRLGQDNATLLGSLLLTSLEQAALTRADIPENERKDHYVYLDEFQTLTTPSTAIMLSESRKYRLCLTLSHQLTGQLNEATRVSVLGNCGTLIAFRIGSEDAELLAPAFSKSPGQLKPQDLTNLPNYMAYVRLLVDGIPSNPFSMITLPQPKAADDRHEIVCRTSQRRCGRLHPPSFGRI